MGNRKVAVVGVLYPEVSLYFDSYLESLQNQTFKEFDLLLMNDGLKNVEDYFKNYSLLYEIFLAQGTPAKIRHDLIKITLDQGYEYIIFTDCDDFFSLDRIDLSIQNLQKNSIVVNDLDIVSANGELKESLYFSNRIDDQSIIKKEDILNANIMGLSNTASRADVLRKCLSFLDLDLIAFDWILWTYALNFGFTAKFISQTTSKYRVHPSNIAGLPQKINKTQVERGLSIKVAHYKKLANLGMEYETLYNDFSVVEKKCQNKIWFDKYILSLKSKQVQKPTWWENIKTPKEVGLS